MFERYTDRARRAVVLAQEQARMLHHTEIDVDHMLLGLAAEGGGVAFHALGSLGLREDAMRDALTAGRLAGITHSPGHLPFTRELKRALELGLRESLLLGHNYIGTEHLLLGLMKDCDRPGSPCGAILKACETTPQEVREQVMLLLRGYGDAPAAPAPDVQALAARLDEIIVIARAMKQDLLGSVDGLGAGEDDR
jgi:ATP-dependent Clp protease ATP-binding subunit ClpC